MTATVWDLDGSKHDGVDPQMANTQCWSRERRLPSGLLLQYGAEIGNDGEGMSRSLCSLEALAHTILGVMPPPRPIQGCQCYACNPERKAAMERRMKQADAKHARQLKRQTDEKMGVAAPKPAKRAKAKHTTAASSSAPSSAAATAPTTTTTDTGFAAKYAQFEAAENEAGRLKKELYAQYGREMKARQFTG